MEKTNETRCKRTIMWLLHFIWVFEIISEKRQNSSRKQTIEH